MLMFEFDRVLSSNAGAAGPGLSVRRHVPTVEFDRHDSEHVLPVWLVLEDLSQLRRGRFACQKQVQRLVA